MKKLFALLIIITILISIPMVAAANAKPNVKKAIFVQRIDSFARPEGAGKPPKPSPEPEEPQLYELMGRNIKWISPVDLKVTINPTGNLDAVDDVTVVSTITASANTWNIPLQDTDEGDLFGSYETDLVVGNGDSYEEDAIRDGINRVFFADISLKHPSAIAVCIVYYINVGPPSQRRILEFDVVFDAEITFIINGEETDFSWGNAGTTDENNLGNTLIMDLQNIATHELGHALGLADLYDTTAPVPEQTMYGYASPGETKKRTLEDGDKAGITVLYG